MSDRYYYYKICSSDDRFIEESIILRSKLRPQKGDPIITYLTFAFTIDDEDYVIENDTMAILLSEIYGFEVVQSIFAELPSTINEYNIDSIKHLNRNTLTAINAITGKSDYEVDGVRAVFNSIKPDRWTVHAKAVKSLDDGKIYAKCCGWLVEIDRGFRANIVENDYMYGSLYFLDDTRKRTRKGSIECMRFSPVQKSIPDSWEKQESYYTDYYPNNKKVKFAF